jgi:hypothetical protein
MDDDPVAPAAGEALAPRVGGDPFFHAVCREAGVHCGGGGGGQIVERQILARWSWWDD